MKRKIRVLLLVFGGFMAFVVAPFLAQRADAASAAVEGLIAGARREGNLGLFITSRMGEKGSREMIETFKRRFGLDITIRGDLSGNESPSFVQAIGETKGKIPPSYDLLEGTAENVLLLKEAGELK